MARGSAITAEEYIYIRPRTRACVDYGCGLVWPNRENIFRSVAIRENIGPRKKPAIRYYCRVR